MDFDVKPHQEIYMVEYKNSLCEDGLGQPYNQTSYVELWILLLPPTFVWTCLHFAIVEIYVSSLHNPKICSYITLWQPSMFVKVMVEICSMIKLSSSIFIIYGLSNHGWSSIMRTFRCIRYLLWILEFYFWPLN